ncbi:MAG: hypothetical protein KAV87_59195 [Desulfobacteraceae bacterium]|nr:hypothetical protein [Desulfobacteraceae bacterium]
MKNLRKFFILFSLCLFLIMAWESKGVQEQETTEPQDITITITVDKNGEIKCDPDPAYARHKDTAIWKSDYAFTVDFSKKTPFKEKHFRANREEAKKGKGGKVTYAFKGAKETLKRKNFKYLVAVFYEGRILTADPNLIIRR